MFRSILLLLAILSLSCEQSFPTAPMADDKDNLPDIPVIDGVEADEYLTIDPKSHDGRISTLLTGANLLYCYEKDELWKDGSPMMEALRNMKSGVLRYPGGKIVEAWHWDSPNGQFGMDSWKPGYNAANNRPDTEFMDLEEYMQLCRSINAEPLVGINTTSGKLYRKEGVAASVEEAKRLVSHCVEHNYGVKYYYIGNEPYHNNATQRLTPEEYAADINLFADAIHSIDPQALIVANWDRNVTSKNMATLLRLAGKNIDIMEVHWYWNWGLASWDFWKVQIPMSAKTQFYAGGKAHYEEVKKFKEMASKLECGHIRFASLEWNIGPSENPKSVPDEYQLGLMQGEMLLQFMEADLCMATFWPLHYGNSDDPRYMFDASDNYRRRPTADLFSQLSQLLGGEKLTRVSTSSELYSIVSKGEDNITRIALLNKCFSPRTCALNIDGDRTQKEISAVCYMESEVKGQAKIDLNYDAFTQTNGVPVVELPAYSITVVTLK